jgi:hypothetical protein
MQEEAMTNCNETRKLIDETDSPELFSYEAARHIESCLPCKDFAQERARLRHLLASSARVAAPPDFDVVLSARLSEVRSRRTVAEWLFSWIGPAGVLRFGAATAAVVIGIFAASYSGLFSSPAPTVRQEMDGLAVVPPEPVVPAAPVNIEQPSKPQEISSGERLYVASNAESRRARRASHRPVIVEPELAKAATQTVIVRGENFEREVPMPTVSVGAQPLLYVGTGRSSAGGLRASF